MIISWEHLISFSVLFIFGLVLATIFAIWFKLMIIFFTGPPKKDDNHDPSD